MHLTSGHCLKSSLQELGLRTLFDRQLSDLSVMSEGNSAGRPQQAANFDATEQLLFGRMSVEDSKRTKRDVSYKTLSENSQRENPLTVKDFMLRKRIVKKSEGKKLKRSKRQYRPFSAERLDVIRHMKGLRNPHLFADEVLHKVDLTITEKGKRSVTELLLLRTSFKLIIQHCFQELRAALQLQSLSTVRARKSYCEWTFLLYSSSDTIQLTFHFSMA